MCSIKADVWKIHKKYINPSFNFKIINGFSPVFNEKAKVFVSVVEEHVGKVEFDVLVNMSAFSLDTLFATLLGIEGNIQLDHENNEYLKNMEMYVYHTYMCYFYFIIQY